MLYGKAYLRLIRYLVVLLGSNSFSALGLISVEVTRKKISNRNTISVMEDIVKVASTLVFLFIAIT